ncbi:MULTISPECIES: leucine-rich repeat domain-containing protein [unclassified Treponema]|uniref:leucine-rich repeat domain-containing protein n=1 Tax=unclassified Treponema TaxID=2638727 RepID=UPI0020A5D118|nr:MULTISPECIES: leucine-rich repeat domain-containing protein [unclassified Treponema]UTC65921.1 leucine-rich repeat domain-containing protein [Treponema sp. OMZ 789]UTC68649.1 leucine-rich repeat domain-containing protein [Treponema sp. OMZ 790]UTC71379.1 leucine-rich repeat domain-containing protein [Treponema sp. OMZ 791]
MMKNFCKFTFLIVFGILVFSCPENKGQEENSETQEVKTKTDSKAGQILENKAESDAQDKAEELYQKALKEASILFEFESVNKKIGLSLRADESIKIEGAVPSEIPIDGSVTEIFVAKPVLALTGRIKELKIHDAEILKNIKIVKAADLKLLDISFSGIKNIEFLNCPSLENLSLESNKELDNVDLSSLKGLKKLNLASAKINKVDFSAFPHLEYLDISSTRLKYFDVKKNVELKELYCENSDLKTLDLTKNKKLTHLNCRANKLTDLILFQNKELKSLDCGKNELDKLFINVNTKLQKLHCDSNLLKELDISPLKEIEDVYCYRNKIEKIILTSNENLKTLFCFENMIDEKSMKDLFDSLIEGDGYNFKTLVVYAEKNPGLIYKSDKFFDKNFIPTEKMLEASYSKFWNVYFTLYGIEDSGSIIDSLVQKNKK